MTENKRFTMDNPNDWGYPITDKVTGKVYSCASNIRMKDLCKVINKIANENEQLKEDCEIYKILWEQMSYYFQDNKTLKDLDHTDFHALQRLAKGLID